MVCKVSLLNQQKNLFYFFLFHRLFVFFFFSLKNYADLYPERINNCPGQMCQPMEVFDFQQEPPPAYSPRTPACSPHFSLPGSCFVLTHNVTPKFGKCTIVEHSTYASSSFAPEVDSVALPESRGVGSSTSQHREAAENPMESPMVLPILNHVDSSIPMGYFAPTCLRTEDTSSSIACS